MHEVCTDSESFDDTNNDEDAPYCCKREPFLKENSSNFEEREDHQNDEVPEIEQALHISIKSILSDTDFLYFFQEADSDKNNNFNISREF